jgi:hypothetical protein
MENASTEPSIRFPFSETVLLIIFVALFLISELLSLIPARLVEGNSILQVIIHIAKALITRISARMFPLATSVTTP